MAEDGTGGLVYLKRVDGVAHVFVSRYMEGHWLAPIRVDTEEPYAASWPRIGAADGGELIVVWATPFATDAETGKPVYELLGAELGPGAERFGQAIIVDRNIEEATGTNPDLAVSSTGQADVVYRVVNIESRRLAVATGRCYRAGSRRALRRRSAGSNLGAINRDTAVGDAPPDRSQRAAASRSARPATASSSGRSRNSKASRGIWARRIFGATLDYVMPVSAKTYKGAPIADDAERSARRVHRLGQADIAYRQAPGRARRCRGRGSS